LRKRSLPSTRRISNHGYWKARSRGAHQGTGWHRWDCSCRASHRSFHLRCTSSCQRCMCPRSCTG
jgi:hypothetical protein